jgi:hypothetical protein
MYKLQSPFSQFIQKSSQTVLEKKDEGLTMFPVEQLEEAFQCFAYVR